MKEERSSYRLLTTSSPDADESDSQGSVDNTTSGPKLWKCTLVVLALLLMTSNVFLAFLAFRNGTNKPEKPYWGSDKILLKPFHWTTEYSNENKTEASPIWSDLFPIGDGLVRLKDDWASDQQLPLSIKRYHYSDESVYFVAAYHQLHCLAIIRSVLYHLKEGKDLTVPFAHATHCLDSLRQSTMCHADDTLLYTKDTHTYGDGQPRVCKDWEALAQWTVRNRIYVEEYDGPRSTEEA